MAEGMRKLGAYYHKPGFDRRHQRRRRCKIFLTLTRIVREKETQILNFWLRNTVCYSKLSYFCDENIFPSFRMIFSGRCTTFTNHQVHKATRYAAVHVPVWEIVLFAKFQHRLHLQKGSYRLIADAGGSSPPRCFSFYTFPP